MFQLLIAILVRIFSNSYLNVFQKLLTTKGEYSSVVNFYTYLGLTIIGVIICPNPNFSIDYLNEILLMGFLGALGNFFIIKALSCGELSALAPINSYKPIVSLIIGVLILDEIPGIKEFFAIALILFGTLILTKSNLFFCKATFYRFLALIFLGTEAIFIKKVILLSGINSTFLYWVTTGLIFAILFTIVAKHPLKIKKENIKYQIILILLVATMQYMTNYVFEKMNVAYALALFQLSSIISIFLGVNLFQEREFFKKIIASVIMLVGATILFLN